jgi:hypothetical protein
MNRYRITYSHKPSEEIEGKRFEAPSDGRLLVYGSDDEIITVKAAGQWSGINFIGQATEETESETLTKG